MAGHLGNTRGDPEFCGREKDRQKTTRDQIVDLAFGLAQFTRNLKGGENGKVIRHLLVVENTPVGLNPLLLADGFCKRSEEHTSEVQSLMSSTYAVTCLKKKKNK